MTTKSSYLEADPTCLPSVVNLAPAPDGNSPACPSPVAPPNTEHAAVFAPALREVIEATVASVFDIDAELLRQPNRGRANVALARQVAMYIAHVGCGMSLTEVGELFERDRTTVAHACGVVEQRRDDQRFDAAINLLDLIIHVINGTTRTKSLVAGASPAFDLAATG